MAKVKISREEIEKMLEEQFSIQEVKWDKQGNVTIEVDFNELKEKEVVREHHYHPPIYINPSPRPYWRKGWTITTNCSTAATSTKNTGFATFTKA